MKNMPKTVLDHFMKGEHTVQHTKSFFNGLWPDMAIESTYMRFGHASSGIVGQAMKPETVKTWAYSMSACCELTESLEKMRDKNLADNIHHKEEMTSRIATDEVDHSLLRKKLESSVDVFDHAQHPKDGLVHITSGKVITDPKVNVNDSLNEGKRLMQMFESKLPEGFYEPIP